MVEISYGAHGEQAHLAGQSVAQARERYQALFNIPDRAKASVNGKRVEKNLEPETKLRDGDELSFPARRRLLPLIGAVALALGLTTMIFVNTYTTASLTTGLMAASADIAEVDARATGLPNWDTIPANISGTLPGRFTGAMPEGYLFEISPTVHYSGDLTVKVYLANAGEMDYAYQHFNMRLQLLDNHGNYANVGSPQAYGSGTVTGTNGITTTAHSFQLLTLDNGVATFELDYTACLSGTGWYSRPYEIYLAGGSFKTEPYHPFFAVGPGGMEQHQAGALLRSRPEVIALQAVYVTEALFSIR